MLEFFKKLFATDFMAHVYCLRLPEVIWLHVTSDLLIATSYFLIPLTLVLLVRRRNDLAFSWMFMLFGIFILACGTTHLLNVWTLWRPMYRLEGVVKALTALASVPTAFLLFRLLPQMTALPSPARLREEIQERQAAEERTRRLNSDLERLVDECTEELRRINARLRDSERRFQVVAQAATNIIWTTDADGQMRGQQPEWAAFTGQTSDEYQGLGFVMKIHSEDRPATLAAWERAISEHTRFDCEHRVCRRDGEWRLCKVVALPVLNEDGAVREWVGTHTDISEQRQAEQEAIRARTAAEAADRAKSSFLAGISHELRTPLNAIIGYSDLMDEELHDAALTPFREDLNKVRSSGKHLLELINDLLDLRKIEAGRMDLYVEEFEISDLVRELAGTVRPLMQKNGNQLEIHAEPELSVMVSDLTKLRQSLRNVLSNAAKFTERGRVDLVVEADGQDVVFHVRDTGMGIAPHLIAKLFEPFTQAEPSTSRRYGGTGLGLALTRRYCQLLGGEISVVSSSERGSTFSIRVPRRLTRVSVGEMPGYEEFRSDLANYANNVRDRASS